jgi:hypothetical protein
MSINLGPGTTIRAGKAALPRPPAPWILHVHHSQRARFSHIQHSIRVTGNLHRDPHDTSPPKRVHHYNNPQTNQASRLLVGFCQWSRRNRDLVTAHSSNNAKNTNRCKNSHGSPSNRRSRVHSSVFPTLGPPTVCDPALHFRPRCCLFSFAMQKPLQ